jgi:hypothetical protein
MSSGTTVPYADRLIEGGEGPFDDPYPGRDFMAMTRFQKEQITTKIQRSIRDRLSSDALRKARFT